MISTIGKRRIRKLIAFLLALPPRKFLYSSLVTKHDENNCGTVCCAAGWLPALDPKKWTWSWQQSLTSRALLPRLRGSITSLSDSLSEYFDIDECDVDRVFFFASEYVAAPAVKPYHVAALLQYLVTYGAFNLDPEDMLPTSRRDVARWVKRQCGD